MLKRSVDDDTDHDHAPTVDSIHPARKIPKKRGRPPADLMSAVITEGASASAASSSSSPSKAEAKAPATERPYIPEDLDLDPESKLRRTNYRLPENKVKLSSAVQEILNDNPVRCPGLKSKCLALAQKYGIPANTIRDNYLRIRRLNRGDLL